MTRFVVLAALGLPAVASAVPMQLTHTGRLFDANGSGNLDIAVLTASSVNVDSDSLTLLINNGNDTFAEPTSF